MGVVIFSYLKNTFVACGEFCIIFDFSGRSAVKVAISLGVMVATIRSLDGSQLNCADSKESRSVHELFLVKLDV